MSEHQPITLAPNGKPWPQEAEAKRYMKDKELDLARFTTIRQGGGWVVIDVKAITAPADEMLAKPEKLEFWEGEFLPRGSTNDCPHVPLSAQGFQVNVQRGKPVVLPRNMWEDCAGHAVRRSWERSDDPLVPMRDAGEVANYPHRILRKDATEAEFRKGLAEGNRITNEFIQRLKKQAA